MAAAAPPKPPYDYPRPPLVHDHGQLFKEPSYRDGEPYANASREEEEVEGW